MNYSEKLTNILTQKSILDEEEEAIINEVEEIRTRIREVRLQRERGKSIKSIKAVISNIETDLTLLKKRDEKHTLEKRNLQNDLIAIKYLSVV
jgi:hypothetical protein